MICDTRRKGHFSIIILFVIDKRVNMIVVWLLQGSEPNKDVFLSL